MKKHRLVAAVLAAVMTLSAASVAGAAWSRDVGGGGGTPNWGPRAPRTSQTLGETWNTLAQGYADVVSSGSSGNRCAVRRGGCIPEW